MAFLYPEIREPKRIQTAGSPFTHYKNVAVFHILNENNVSFVFHLYINWAVDTSWA